MKIFLFALQIFFAISFICSFYDFITYEKLLDGIETLIFLIAFYESVRWIRWVE